jgi:hypothetical protein
MTPPHDLGDYWTLEEIARTLWALQYIADVWATDYGHPAHKIAWN